MRRSTAPPRRPVGGLAGERELGEKRRRMSVSMSTSSAMTTKCWMVCPICPREDGVRRRERHQVGEDEEDEDEAARRAQDEERDPRGSR